MQAKDHIGLYSYTTFIVFPRPYWACVKLPSQHVCRANAVATVNTTRTKAFFFCTSSFPSYFALFIDSCVILCLALCAHKYNSYGIFRNRSIILDVLQLQNYSIFFASFTFFECNIPLSIRFIRHSTRPHNIRTIVQ